MTCGCWETRGGVQVEIQGCRATRSHRSTSSKLPPSTRPPWSACRPPVAVAEWWRGRAGGSPFPPGCAADSSASPAPPPIWPMQQLDTYLPATPAAQLGLTRAAQCLTPLSLLKGLPASPCPPTAHEASALPPSLFSTAAAPFSPPQPYPTLDHNLPVHHSQHTTTTTKLNPPSPPPLPLLLLPANTALSHGVRLICSPGQSRAIRLQTAARVPAPAWPRIFRHSSRWILPTSGVGLRPRSQNLHLFPLLRQLLPPPPRFLPLRLRPSRPSIAQSR